MKDAAFRLENDKSRKGAILAEAKDPWSLAITIGELISAGLRWREIVPNPSARMRFLQVAHHNNLLSLPRPDIRLFLLEPENPFEPVAKREILDKLTSILENNVSIGDVLKIEKGWVAVIGFNINQLFFGDKFLSPMVKPHGFNIKELSIEEINMLPSCTASGLRTATAASARIDAVSSVILKPSREQIKKLIDAGGVLLNYKEVNKPGKEVMEGDIISVRNAGRFRLAEISGKTKKGRIAIKAEVLNGA